MATPLEKRKTIFNNGVPKYTRVQTEFATGLTKEFGGQPIPSNLPNMASRLGITVKGTGTYDPKGLAAPPVPKTYQEVITIGQNTLVQKLNDYPYIERRNDILQLGDSRGRGQKYPPESLLHLTGGPGYPGHDVDDLFVRGGIVQSSAIAAEDVVRISNFYASPKGILWLVREQGLQMTNPRPETRLFNPVTLLLNTAGQHLGLHLPRHGLNPFGLGQGNLLDFGYNTYSTAKDYEYGEKGGKSYTVTPLVAVPRNQPKLLDLVSEMKLGKKDINLTKISLLDVAAMFGIPGTNIAGYQSPRDEAAGGPEISTTSYQAAANSPYGGFSIFGAGMHRSVNTGLDYDGLSLHKYPREGDGGISQLIGQVKQLINSPLSALSGLTSNVVGAAAGALGVKVPGGSSIPTTSPEVLKAYKSLAYGELGLSTKLYVSTDRDTLQGPSDNYAVYAKVAGRKPSTREHMLTRRGFSDPGAMGTRPDQTNATPRWPGVYKDGTNDQDLVPLIFYDIFNDASLVFRAVLNGITDTITPEWNEYTYVGNPQTYYTYKRTTRDFAFTFKVYTDTEQELKWNWMKINRFIGMLYPSYNKQSRMVGPFLKLTIGDMLNLVPGYLSALTVTIDDNTPWEINLFSDPELAKLPHVVECGVTYRVVGNEPLNAESTKFYAQNKMYQDVWKWTEWRGHVQSLEPRGLPSLNFNPPTTLQPISVPGF